MISIWRSFLSAVGSHSSDISSSDSIDNPLPPCPDSPNCVRITKKIERPVESVYEAAIKALETMKPIEINTSIENYKIDTVFKVFFFRDDMTVQLSRQNSEFSYLHIRSASQVGFSDLGVNKRRVNQFLNRLQDRLS